MNRIHIVFKRIKNNPRIVQVLGLFSVNIIGIPITIATSIIMTHYLGAVQYGNFKFLNSIFDLGVIVFNFGFIQAANRALVLNYSKKKAKELYGATLIIVSLLFLSLSFFLIIYALFDANVEQKKLQHLLFFLIPFGWVYFFTQYFETLFQGDNRINLLAQFRLYPKILILISAFLMYIFLAPGSIEGLWFTCFIYLTTQIIITAYLLYKLNLSFRNTRENLKTLLHYNKIYGLNVYVGSVIAVGFAKLSEILISYFGVNNSGVAYYSLAVALCMPLSFIPNTIATTHYKDFSISPVMPKKLFALTIVISISALLFLWLIIGPFVKVFYGNDFIPVVKLTVLISLAVLMYGFADFFNRFLGSHGKGKILRNSAIFTGIVILIGSLLLTPTLHETGAAISMLLAGSVYLLNMIYYYFCFLNGKC